MGRPKSWRKTVVVGAGPVGSLAALYAANRGDEVEIYELRPGKFNALHEDTFKRAYALAKSINLALSERGINGLRGAGHDDLLSVIFDKTVPMHGRMIHTRSTTGSLASQSQAYDVHGRYLRSVDRGELNKCLLNKLESMPNVRIHFQHKLTGADLRAKKAWFEIQTSKVGRRYSEIEVNFDFLIGADGAHSAVRFHMMKFARVDFAQTYIDSLWCEFTMQQDPELVTPSNPQGYQVSPNHLHIWPATTSMFIAIPSSEGTFVCTLFGPVSLFELLEKGNEDDLIHTFNNKFPGVTDLIPPLALISQFKRNPHLPLISIKCSPHHFSDSTVILGDAAHAMVPFYGQGMNAGLESVRALFETIDTCKEEGLAMHETLQRYTATRSKDAHAIADLALGNYHEMSAGVVSPRYKLRKWIEERLDKWLPSLGWSTQYARVSFSNTRYSQVIEQSERQTNVLEAIFAMASTGVVGGVAWYVWKFTSLGRRAR